MHGIRQKVTGVVLACGAMTALAIGVAAPANAAVLGTQSVSSSANSFPSKNPSWEQVERVAKGAGLNACKSAYGQTKKVLMKNYYKDGNYFVSVWHCQS